MACMAHNDKTRSGSGFYTKNLADRTAELYSTNHSLFHFISEYLQITIKVNIFNNIPAG